LSGCCCACCVAGAGPPSCFDLKLTCQKAPLTQGPYLPGLEQHTANLLQCLHRPVAALLLYRHGFCHLLLTMLLCVLCCLAGSGCLLAEMLLRRTFAVFVAVAVDAPNLDVFQNHDVYQFFLEWSCFKGRADVKRMVRSSQHCWSRVSLAWGGSNVWCNICLEELFPSCC
jgi:hypothetical protein